MVLLGKIGRSWALLCSSAGFYVCFFVWLLYPSGRAFAQPISGQLRAGADARPLVNLSGVPLAGYGGGDRRKTIPWTEGYTFFFQAEEGEQDLVRVKTMVIEVDGPPAKLFALVSIDAVGLADTIVVNVVEQLEGTGLNRENIMFLATHTHSGPGALTDKVFWQIVAADVLNNELFDHTVGNIVDSVGAALDDLQPAKLGIGVGYETEISANRRHDNAPVDTRVGVIKVVDENDEPIGVLFNFAVHGTCLGSGNMLRSADNMGYAERKLETELSGAVALFANAAEGDVKPTGGGFDGAQVVGETLADKVLEIWDTTDATDTAVLEIQTSLESLPPLELNLTACDDLVAQLMDTWLLQLPGPVADEEALFMAARINEHALVTLPGEALTEIGFQVQDELAVQGFQQVLIMGLANGFIGYIMTPEEYDLGGYEACGTLHGRETGEFVKEKAVTVGMALSPIGGPEPDGAVDAGDHDGAVIDAQVGQDAGLDATLENDSEAPGDGAANDGSTQGEPASSGCNCTYRPGKSGSRPGSNVPFYSVLWVLLITLALAIRSSTTTKEW